MTPLHPGLLRAILDDPADDSVRLVAADFLEEHGETDRAEFIRVQVELARHGNVKFVHEQTYLACESGKTLTSIHGPGILKMGRIELTGKYAREQDLWTRVAGDLLDGIPDEFVPRIWGNASDQPGCLLRRGFVEEITCPWKEWATHHAAILSQQPVTAVTLTTWPEFYLGREQKISTMKDEIPNSFRHTFSHDFSLETLSEFFWPRIAFTLPAANIRADLASLRRWTLGNTAYYSLPAPGTRMVQNDDGRWREADAGEPSSYVVAADPAPDETGRNISLRRVP